MTPEIVILAMIAAFLGLRLYSVLGKRTGHEQEHMPRRVERETEPQQPRQIPAQERAEDKIVDIRASESQFFDPIAEPGVRSIVQADRSFDVARFVDGARAAYGMILDAFWKGDTDDLEALCDEDVFAGFRKAIEEREKRGETLDNRLVRIEEARIVEADYLPPEGRITLRFDADIAAVVRDKDGNHIAGTLDDAVETHDIWTFARDLTSSDPNWKLVATDEA